MHGDCGVSLTEISRETLTRAELSPKSERSGIELPREKKEDEKDSQFLVRDTNSGVVYDLSQPDETKLLRAIEQLTTFQNKDKSQPWQQWWAIKKERNSQLLLASENGDADVVADLLDSAKHGDLVADITTKDLDDFTALHYAASEGRIEVTRALLSHYAPVDALSTARRTPLHIACYRGNLPIISLLAERGANINAQENEGNTPSHILSECGWQEALQWMLSRGPNLQIKNSCGLTAVDVAANVEIHRLFISKVAAPAGDPGYSRTVVDRIILHNNRADMIKSLMFKGQMLASQCRDGGIVGAGKKEEPQQKSRPPKENKKRRVKIIEAARNVSRLSHCMERKMEAPGEDDGSTVGPEYFQPIQMLGKGSFGEVYLVKYKPTGKLYAMKVLNKSRFMSQNLLKYAMAERNVLCYTKHPFIVSLDFAFQTSEKLFLILEYCPGYGLSLAIRVAATLARSYGRRSASPRIGPAYMRQKSCWPLRTSIGATSYSATSSPRT